MTERILYLIGFPGAGKSTVGREVARLLTLAFFDLDEIVERESERSISEIFRLEGEGGFRLRETEALRGLAIPGGAVVALGGGTWCFEENRTIAAARGVAVWLDCSLRICLERTRAPERPERPLLQDPESVRRIYEIRKSDYRRASFRVETDSRAPAESARAIAEWFSGLDGPRANPLSAQPFH